MHKILQKVSFTHPQKPKPLSVISTPASHSLTSSYTCLFSVPCGKRPIPDACLVLITPYLTPTSSTAFVYAALSS